jgi:hypothetical protein
MGCGFRRGKAFARLCVSPYTRTIGLRQFQNGGKIGAGTAEVIEALLNEASLGQGCSKIRLETDRFAQVGSRKVDFVLFQMPSRAIEMRDRKSMAIFVRIYDGRTCLDGCFNAGRMLAARRYSFDRIRRQAERQ